MNDYNILFFVLLQLGVVLIEQGKQKEALKKFETALKFNPKHKVSVIWSDLSLVRAYWMLLCNSRFLKFSLCFFHFGRLTTGNSCCLVTFAVNLRSLWNDIQVTVNVALHVFSKLSSILPCWCRRSVILNCVKRHLEGEQAPTIVSFLCIFMFEFSMKRCI